MGRPGCVCAWQGWAGLCEAPARGPRTHEPPRRSRARQSVSSPVHQPSLLTGDEEELCIDHRAGVVILTIRPKCQAKVVVACTRAGVLGVLRDPPLISEAPFHPRRTWQVSPPPPSPRPPPPPTAPTLLARAALHHHAVKRNKLAALLALPLGALGVGCHAACTAWWGECRQGREHQLGVWAGGRAGGARGTAPPPPLSRLWLLTARPWR